MTDLFVSYVVENFRTEKRWSENKVIRYDGPVSTIDDISNLCEQTGDIGPYRNLTILYWRRMEGAQRPRKCDHCGHSHTPAKPVQYLRDPFIWEIHGECVMCWLCISCEEERRDDI